MRGRYYCLCLLGMMVVPGCDSVLEPQGFVGNYSLDAVNTRPLPVTVTSSDSSCQWTVSYGTLTLGANAFSLAMNLTQSCTGATGIAGLQTTAGGVSVTGSRTLGLSFISDPNGGTTTLDALLDDSTVTISVPAGRLGAPAAASLRFSGRTQGAGCAC